MLHKWQSSKPTSLPHCFQTGTSHWTWYQLEICQLNLTGLAICDLKPFDHEEEECCSSHILLQLGLCWTLVCLKSWRAVGWATAFQREEPGLKGELLTSWNCFSSTSHSVSWPFHNLFMGTGYKCHNEGGDKVPTQRESSDPERAPPAHVVSEADSSMKLQLAVAVFTLWACLHAVPISTSPVKRRLAGIRHFQRKYVFTRHFSQWYEVEVRTSN